MLQRISRTLLLGLISVSFVSGQIDTLDAVSYLPMQIGNKWQYHYYASGEDLGFVLWEITDIVTKDNGLTYFEFNPRLYHTGWFPVRHHLRIDTTTLSVMSYDQGEGCPAPVRQLSAGSSLCDGVTVLLAVLFGFVCGGSIVLR